MTNSPSNLATELENYGVDSRSLRLFNTTASPDLLDYLDLVHPTHANKLLPDGVAESQNRPLLFIINESRLSLSIVEQEAALTKLRRSLACRDERAYLARIRPGELLVVPVSLEDRTPEWKPYRAGTWDAKTFFSHLTLGHYEGKGEPSQTGFVFEEMFNLLKHVADRLTYRDLKKEDILSLIGRALFFRFLRERQVISEQDTKKIAPLAADLLACFQTAENTAATCQWLDITFNGDFLPLTDNASITFFQKIEKQSKGRVFTHLNAIIRGDEIAGPESYQGQLQWGDFDFAHVPVGLLSQVYEAFCWKWDHQHAKETSVHYTPRGIAATLVEEAFDGLPEADRCRVLDPACGSGIFLILAFRRIYRERWRATTERPDTKIIREILEKQLVGFDISDAALKLAALSLYLTAVELDPNPVPPEKLKFKALRNTVLFNFRRERLDPEVGPVIGSLGEHVDNQFNKQFDLVLSNPPWTSLPEKQKALARKFTKVSRAIIRRKREPILAEKYENPDNAPDLPFLWKSTEWCKPGGRIAMALPARILLKQEKTPAQARKILFQLLEVTGIINGSNLADTKVWPEMNQPFMLLFARNHGPDAGHVVQFVTLRYDLSLNRRGEFRIDSKSVSPIEVEAAFAESWLWKAHAVGTSLDVELIRRLKQTHFRTLGQFWKPTHGLRSSNGYQIKERQKQKPATDLQGLPNLNATDLFSFQVDEKRLTPFTLATLARPRHRDVYRAPLVLINVAPGEHRETGRALLAFTDIAYNESYYGYSSARYGESDLVGRYLHLFVHSLIWNHYTLLVSAEFGAERRKFQKRDLDNCPFVPLEKLTANQRETVYELSNRLVSADKTVFDDIDWFFAELYGLDRYDLEVIRDTLAVELPFEEARTKACSPPSSKEKDAFSRRLESTLRPFFKKLDKQPAVVVWKPEDSKKKLFAPFGLLLLGEKGMSIAEPEHFFQDVVLPLANETGASRIIQQVDGGLVIGVISQYRYWTPSRARLLAAEILREHMQVFEE